MPIAFELSQSTTPGEVSGFGTWALPGNAKQLVVRLIAKDLAGNQTEVTRLPQLPKTATHGLGMQLASQPKGLPTPASTDIVLGPIPRRAPSTGLPVRELSDSELESMRSGDGTLLANAKNSQSLLAREPANSRVIRLVMNQTHRRSLRYPPLEHRSRRTASRLSKSRFTRTREPLVWITNRKRSRGTDNGGRIVGDDRRWPNLGGLGPRS